MLLVPLVVAVAGDGIGASDCERLRDGALAQPVNALTSFAYVVVGVLIAVAATRRPAGVRLPSWVFAAVLAAVGVGSVLFHGPQPAGSRLAHDLPITLAVAFIVVWDALHLAERRDRTIVIWLAGSVPLTVLAAVAPDAAVALTGAGVVAAIVLEVVIARRRPRGTATHRRRIAIAVAVTAVAAGASYALGRTGSATCDPDAVVQFHGAWHLLTAVIFGLWWSLALGSDDARPSDDTST